MLAKSLKLCPTLCDIDHWALLSMRFSRQEYWSGLPCPPSGDLPNLGIEPTSPSLLYWQAGSLLLEPPGKPQVCYITSFFPSRIQPGSCSAFSYYVCFLVEIQAQGKHADHQVTICRISHVTTFDKTIFTPQGENHGLGLSRNVLD